MTITKNIKDRLIKLFDEKPPLMVRRNIVFWVDKEKEFVDDIKDLNLEGVRILYLTEFNRLKTKLDIEENILEQNLLIYTNLNASNSDNWLMDVYHYAIRFEPTQYGSFLQDFGWQDTIENKEFFTKHSKAIKSLSKKILESYNYKTIDQLSRSLLTALYKKQQLFGPINY